MMNRPTIRIREWSKVVPASSGDGAVLRGLRLTDEDRDLRKQLQACVAKDAGKGFA